MTILEAPSLKLDVTGWWDHYRGDGIRVNVVDTGIQTGHPALRDNVDRDNDRDYRDDDYDPNPLPKEDLGTAVDAASFTSLLQGMMAMKAGTPAGLA